MTSRDEDEAWRAIVENYGERARLDDGLLDVVLVVLVVGDEAGVYRAVLTINDRPQRPDGRAQGAGRRREGAVDAEDFHVVQERVGRVAEVEHQVAQVGDEVAVAAERLVVALAAVLL